MNRFMETSRSDRIIFGDDGGGGLLMTATLFSNAIPINTPLPPRLPSTPSHSEERREEALYLSLRAPITAS